MSEKYIARIAPFTAADAIITGWAKRVREAVVRDGQAVRGTKDFCIEAQFINDPDKWGQILLPNGAYQFSSIEDMLTALDMIEGKRPIPEAST